MPVEAPADLTAWIYSLRPVRWLFRRGALPLAVLVGALMFLIINGSAGNLTGRSIQLSHQLEVEGRRTVAHVTGAGLQHYGCSFSYSVDGRVYNSAETGCGGDKVGAALPVTYDRSYPIVVTAGDPTSEYRQNLAFFYGGPLAFAVFAYLGFRYQFRKKTRELVADASDGSR